MRRVIAVGCCLLGLAVCVRTLEGAPRPNILFVLVDDQRNDSLGCAGHPILKTPNIDRLAAGGVRFENAFVTTSICMASRATIFTGLCQRTHGYRPADPQGSASITDDRLASSFPTILREAGYHTGYYGKNHVVYAKGTKQAFGEMFDDWQHISRHPYFKTMPDGGKRHTGELIGDRSVAFLRERPEDKPFFLYMSFNISHAEDSDRRPGIGHFPWPKAEDGLYEEIVPGPPRLAAGKYFDVLPDFLKTSLNRKRWYWRWDTPEKYTVNMRAYFRMLTGMDRIVGRVQKELALQGVADDTVIIYTADNGYYMGDRGFAGKWSHFEQSLRVPMIVFDPRLADGLRGRVVSDMALNLDVPSTILDIAGLPIPDMYQGMSLLPAVNALPGIREGRSGSGVLPRDGFFCEHHQHGGMIPGWSGFREARFMYARYDRRKPAYEFLHDLERDPDQVLNLAGDPAYREHLARLRQRTDDAIARYTRQETIDLQRASRRGPGRAAKSRPASPYKGGRALFDGRACQRLADTPALEATSSYTWAVRVKVLPNNPPGAVLLGNRGGTPLNFLKLTAGKGAQLFVRNRQIFRLENRLSRGTWTDVALIKKGPTMMFVVDGRVVGDVEVGDTIPAMPCFLGGDPQVPGEMARAEVANAVVLSRAVNPAALDELLAPK